MRRCLALGLLACNLSCDVGMPRSVHHATAQYAPTRTLELHADVAFLPLERAWLGEAADAIEQGSAGLLRVTTTYDLDCASPVSLSQHLHHSLACRADPDAYIVALEESDGHPLLGEVAMIDLDKPWTWGGPVHVFLVADRLQLPFAFKFVAMHELLHALGLKHVRSPGSVMVAKIDLMSDSLPPTCLSRADAAELCRVYECDPATLDTCR